MQLHEIKSNSTLSITFSTNITHLTAYTSLYEKGTLFRNTKSSAKTPEMKNLVWNNLSLVSQKEKKNYSFSSYT